MREIKDDIWKYYKMGWSVIIPSNAHINKGGEAGTGAGLGSQANRFLKDYAKMLGACMKQQGNRVYYFEQARVITFPTKKHWRDKSDLALIKESCLQLQKLMEEMPNLKVVMPKVGCGFGRLKWSKVKSMIAKYFGKYSEDRFLIVDNNQGATKEYLKDNPNNLVDMHDKTSKVMFEDADYRTNQGDSDNAKIAE